MKRYYIMTVLLAITMIATAQNYSIWTHQGDQPRRQCYNIVEMSDGNFVVREAVFDDYGNDIGYNLYKITPQGELLDSLFLEDHNIFSLNPMLRDPNNSNTNIMTSFYNLDGVNYYKATYFNDNLEITDETITEYYDNCYIPKRFLIDSENDIICSSKLGDNTYCLVRMDLNGIVKAQSDTINDLSNAVVQYPFFEISSDPLKYGVVWPKDNGIYIEVYDEDFTKLTTKKLPTTYAGWMIKNTYYTTACGTGDGGFIITTEANKFVGAQTLKTILVLKCNADFGIEKSYQLGPEFTLTAYPQYELHGNNLLVTGNSVYLVWKEKKTGSEGAKHTLIVTRLDKDLNFTWEDYTLEVTGGSMANDDITPLLNGGVAVCGWYYGGGVGYYGSKDIYAVVCDNYMSSTEITDTEKLFVCHPNPAQDIVNISFSEDVTCQSVEIYSIDGRLVETFPETSHQTTIDISGLHTGVYIMKVRLSDGKEYEEKIVKE